MSGKSIPKMKPASTADSKSDNFDRLNEANVILGTIESIADLMAFASFGDMQQFTLQVVSLHIWQMAQEAKHLINEVRT